MKWLAAVVLISAALVAGGVWLSFGGTLQAGGPDTPAGAVSAEAEAPPATATAEGTAEGAADGADPGDEAAAAPPDADGAASGSVPADGSPEDGSPEDGAPTATATGGYTPVDPLTDEPVQSFEAPDTVLDPSLDYRAVIETTAGTLVVDLYDDRVPMTVDNFVFLALHRYYQDVPFHRVLDDFMAQTGDPTGTGSGGPGYVFDDEIVADLVHDRPGLLSMANAGPGTNGSQFFVTFAAAPWLDGNHAVFGEVIEGIETLDRLTRVDPQTPSALARLAEPVSRLAEQGVPGLESAEGSVEAWLERELGTLPVQGQSFRIGGRRGVLGRVSGAPALGLYPIPDRIERVTIYTAPEEDPS